jgi:hypothetical protein
MKTLIKKLVNQPVYDGIGNKILCIAESPFQLLSAIEARDYFKDEYAILILKYSGRAHKKNDLQLQTTKEFNNFDEVFEIRPFSGVLESNLRLLFILKMFQIKKIEFTKIFISEYRSWYHRKFWDVLAPKENYVLDDGSNTVELQKSYFPTGKYYELSKGLKKKLKQIYFKLISIFLYNNRDASSHKDINLFTCFDLEPYSRSQKVIKNNFSFIKKNASKKHVDESKVYFLGGNLSDLNLLSRDKELSLLESVINYYKGINKELVYIPHRREAAEKLELIRNRFNVDVMTFTYPAEIQFLLMETHPHGIASFVSMALFTVSKMFDFGSVEAFYLPMDDIPEVYRQDFISAYNEYKKTIKVVDINETR